MRVVCMWFGWTWINKIIFKISGAGVMVAEYTIDFCCCFLSLEVCVSELLNDATAAKVNASQVSEWRNRAKSARTQHIASTSLDNNCGPIPPAHTCILAAAVVVVHLGHRGEKKQKREQPDNRQTHNINIFPLFG